MHKETESISRTQRDSLIPEWLSPSINTINNWSMMYNKRSMKVKSKYASNTYWGDQGDLWNVVGGTGGERLAWGGKRRGRGRL